MKDFTQGSILRHLLIFSLPMIANNLIQAIYGVIDAFWVGRLVGHEALAAVSTAMPVIFFTASLLIGLGIAATIMTGQAYGARDTVLLSRIISNSFLGSMGIALGLTAAGILLAPLIVRLLNAPPVIEHDAIVFLRISIAGFSFITITQWFAGLLSGLGDAKRPLIIQVVTIVLNIILAPVFISVSGSGSPWGWRDRHGQPLFRQRWARSWWHGCTGVTRISKRFPSPENQIGNWSRGCSFWDCPCRCR
jgi:Na+-driven multidrug efflux pump